jgi:hypothetical protein
LKNEVLLRSPLDAEEAVAAIALRALPVSGPSPELDARVLAMARSALTASAPQARTPPAVRGRRRPGALWWLGSAAGAVMAAGIGWQLGGFSDPAAPAGEPAAVSAARNAPSASMEAEFEVLIIPRRPADAEEGSTSAGAPKTRAEPVPSERTRPAPLQPLAPGRLEQTLVPTPAPAAAPTEAPREAVSEAPAPMPQVAVPLADPLGTSMPNPEDAPLDEITVTGDRVAGTEFPPVAQDFRLAPDDWIERIRARRDSGDLQSARRSLMAFMRVNAQRPVPADLRPLMNETP